MANYSQWFKRLCGSSSKPHKTMLRTRLIRFEALEERRLLQAAPNDFRVINDSETGLRLEWTDTNQGETGYELQRSITGLDDPDVWSGFGPLLGADQEELNIDAYRSYYFRIRSIGHPGGPSDWTDLADADCTANPVVECPRPTNNPEDNTVKVSAIAHSQIDVPLIAATIELRWPEELAYQDADYSIYRKTKDELSFTLKETLTYDGQNPITGWTDDDLGGKTAYEYKVERTRNFSPTHAFFKFGKTAIGYVYAGVDVPLDDPDSTIESPGTVILVIDVTQKVALATELDRLQDDLFAEGWDVEVIDDVNPSDTPESVRDKIVEKYEADPDNVKAVFLFGHIPVLLSGESSPDGHAARALPADVFYGDMDNDAVGDSIWALSTYAEKAGSVFAIDLDGDGDLDIITASLGVNENVGVTFLRLDGQIVIKHWTQRHRACKLNGSHVIRDWEIVL